MLELTFKALTGIVGVLGVVRLTSAIVIGYKKKHHELIAKRLGQLHDTRETAKAERSTAREPDLENRTIT
jgi:hypothetical protein